MPPRSPWLATPTYALLRALELAADAKVATFLSSDRCQRTMRDQAPKS